MAATLLSLPTVSFLILPVLLQEILLFAKLLPALYTP
jgi:hypothetical protein